VTVTVFWPPQGGLLIGAQAPGDSHPFSLLLPFCSFVAFVVKTFQNFVVLWRLKVSAVALPAIGLN
jgi:hypothetical protein